MPYEYRKTFRKIIIFPFIIYKKLISPLLPRACIYQPSCSEYMRFSIMKFGLFKGTIIGITRILRCNSAFFTGGEDSVPNEFSLKIIKLDYKKYYRFNNK